MKIIKALSKFWIKASASHLVTIITKDSKGMRVESKHYANSWADAKEWVNCAHGDDIAIITDISLSMEYVFKDGNICKTIPTHTKANVLRSALVATW